MEIAISADIKSKTGVFSPQIGVEISALRIVLDSSQIECINQFLDLYLLAMRRCKILLKVPIPYIQENITAPYVSDMGGFHLLPSLSVNGQQYPDEMRLPRSEDSNIASFFRSRSQNWARELWKFAIGIILEDLRLIRPLGRWVELIRLPILRRKYAFYFSKLLKKSAENGNYVFDVKRVPDPTALAHINAIEMQLSIPTILMFRSFGIMVAAVKDFNTQYRQTHGIQKGLSTADSSKLLQWRDIVEIHTEAMETFRSMRRESESMGFEDEDEDDFDDAVSALTDEASFYSSSKKTSSREISASSITKQFVSTLNIVNKAKVAFSTPKFSRRESIPETDELQETRSEASGNSRSPMNSEAGRSNQIISSAMGKISMPTLPMASIGIKSFLKIKGGEAQGQSRSDAVQTVIRRHQSLITIIPPNVYLNLKSFEMSFRTPVISGARTNLMLLSLSVIKAALSISSPVLGNNQGGMSSDKSLGGFASLVGALVQVTFSVDMGRLQVFYSDIGSPESSKADRNSGEFSRGPDDYYTIELDSNNSASKLASPSISKLSSVSLWSSREGQQFLVVCVVLDNDSKKKGAADIQIQFGEAIVNVDGATVAILVDANSSLVLNSKRAAQGLKETFQLLSSMKEKALAVDIETKAPLGLLSLVSDYDDMTEKETTLNFITQADRKAVLAHMNYEYWLSFLYENMPNIITICFRLDKIMMDFLSASSIKDVISSKAKLKADRAAAFNPLAFGRRSRSYTDIRRNHRKKIKGSVLKALNDINKFGVKDGHESEGGHRMKMEINPVEVIFAKTNDPPYPMLTFDFVGGKVSIPIDDDTLCHALAMILAKEVPMLS